MPRRRPLPLRSLSLGLLVGLGLVGATGCGASEEVEATPTTEVTAAAGSGFCLTWTRYDDSLATWLRDPPPDLETTVARAADTLRQAEEARSTVPDDLAEPLDTIVEAHRGVSAGAREADSQDAAVASASEQLTSTDFTAARDLVGAWVDDTC